MNRRYASKIFVFGWDVFFAACSFYFAILVTNNFDLSSTAVFFSTGTLVLLLLRMATYYYIKPYSIVMRHVGERDYKNIFSAVTLSTVLFLLADFLFPQILDVENPLAIITVDYFLLLFPTVGLRLGLRFLHDYLIKSKESYRTNTAIYGAGELGALVAGVLKHNTSHNYRIVAYFDDNPQMWKKSLNGVRIYNPNKSFDAVIKKHNIKVAIIGINALPDKRRLEFIDACLANQVKVLKVPPTQSWINGTLGVRQLTKINLEDLLDRDPIRLDHEMIQHSVKDRVVLVTGCAGSIGSEIVRQLLHYEPRVVIGVDQAETPLAQLKLSLADEVKAGTFIGMIGDVKDGHKIRRIFEQFRPEYVFHAAAYKHVPIMEIFPEEAVKVNVLGTKTVADLSVRYRVKKFVMISTDKVVNPGNVMGASKRLAEMYVQALNFKVNNYTQFITTRFGNVLGSNGSVIPIFKDQIERRDPVTVTHPDVTRYFMTIPEACQLVLEAGTIGNGGEIFVFDMGKPVRIVNLARKMIQLAGLTPGKDIDIVFTGLRPGEKLTEELFNQQEDLIPTHHPKIRKAAVITYTYEELKPKIEELVEGALNGFSTEEVVSLMKRIVPEYRSQNSEYAALDREKKPIA